MKRQLALGGCCVSKCCVCFSSFYVVSDEFSDGVEYTGVCVSLSISVCVCVDCIKCFTHV